MEEQEVECQAGRMTSSEEAVAISIETLKDERDSLKKKLAEIDAEQKVIENKAKDVRQREIQTKREIEALSVLIDLQQPPENKPLPAPAAPGKP
jgi:predicted  nucleic acid-binding Zn-ribbon protein